MNIDELVTSLLDDPAKAKELQAALDVTGVSKKLFIPNAGPQTEAYFSKADILLYGGCVPAETEFLTEHGWKPISEYEKSDKVAQWEQTGKLSFVTPDDYINDPCNEMIEFSNSRFKMVLSPNHRVPLYQWNGDFVVKTAEQLEKKPSRHKIPVHYHVDNVGMDMSDNELRLAVAINADGSIERVRNDGTAQCRMSLRKNRKRERLESLLIALNYKWKEYHNPKRPTEVRYSFYPKHVGKHFDGIWWKANQRQLEIILDEMSYWDGDYSGTCGGDITFSTMHKADADFMQYAAHACGRIATITQSKNTQCYRVIISKEDSVKSSLVFRGDALNIRRVPIDRQYCFRVASSFWLARHEGRIFVTGNCAGGGKSGLGLGLALNEHHRSLVVRRQFTDVHGLFDDCKRIVGTSDGFVGGNRPLYRKTDGGVIHFEGYGDVNDITGKQGTPHDLIFVDEAAQLPLHAILLLMGWCRTVKQGQRTRVVLASNPPLDTTGDWMMQYFGAWLDERHPNPAKAGELRYYVTDEDGNDVEVKSADDYILIKGEKYYPKSRTFIPASVSDNPFINEDYKNQLNMLPEPYRSALRDGNFLNARQDDEWQVIPTAWIRAAQDRWRKYGKPEHVPQCAIGVDVAQGGTDRTVLAIRYDGYFDELVTVEGAKTPDGPSVAALVVQHRRGNPKVIIDMGGGYGGSAYDHLKQNNIDVIGHKGAQASMARTKDKLLGFFNKRSQVWWQFREALDPSQEGGSHIMLPDDPQLVSDLTSPLFEVTSSGIKVEPKDKLCKRLGRSTDKGDAVVMAWAYGQTVVNIRGGWEAQAKRRNTPTVVDKHAAKRRLTGRR